MGNDDDFSRPIRVPTDDPAEFAEPMRRIKAGDAVLFLRWVLHYCSIEQRAELRQEISEGDSEGLMRVAFGIVADAASDQRSTQGAAETWQRSDPDPRPALALRLFD